MGVGILSPDQIRDLLVEGVNHHCRLRRAAGCQFEFNKSAVDLPLGDCYWSMKGSCRTCGALTVRDLIDRYAESGPTELSEGTELGRGQVYLVKLDCWVHFDGTRVQGKATARSSIGRLDVLVRLLGERSPEFDCLDAATQGDLYAEVTPISFDLQVSPGTCLSQLRLFRGEEDLFTLTMEELEYEDEAPVLNAAGEPKRPPSGGPRRRTFPFSLDLTPDPTTGHYGYVARKEPPGPINPGLRSHYDPQDYRDPVQLRDEALLLEPGRLYILSSKERLKLPAHLAVECQAYTETLGEWRIEYAGFAHPYFGSTRENGTPIIFEVRGHNVPTILTDGLHLGNVSFRRMSACPDPPSAGTEEQQYEDQELKLSSCFKPWS